MSVPDNENRIAGSSEQWLDDLLAQDREQVRRATDERITGGMYRRIVRARAEYGHSAAWARRWATMGAVVAVMVLMIWIAMPRRREPLPATGVLRPMPHPITGGRIQTPVAIGGARQAGPRSVRARVPAHPAANVAPRRAIFPSSIVPTGEERLLMELASNHPEQLQAVVEATANMDKQEKEHRQAFEEWLQQGEKR
jgi:hypothetical protein